LKNYYKKLDDENKNLRKTIQNLQDSQGYEISMFFNRYNSIKETQIEYYFETIKDCYEALVDYNGCSDSIQGADDYREYYKEIFGYEYYDNSSDEDNSINENNNNELNINENNKL
jgi:hypothetical protein